MSESVQIIEEGGLDLKGKTPATVEGGKKLPNYPVDLKCLSKNADDIAFHAKEI